MPPMSFLTRLTLIVVAAVIVLGDRISNAYTLSDTGQTKCYDNTTEIPCPQSGAPFFGQDGNYSGTQPAYKDNGDGTVTDLNTKLLWQKQDDATFRTWDDAVSYCSSLGTGWRLPARLELMSIVNYGTYSPSTDKNYFPYCHSGGYWSSTTDAENPANACVVSFADGGLYYNPKDCALCAFVRCVHGSALPKTSCTDNGDGTVLDSTTGLVWQQGEGGQMSTWEDAISYCDTLSLANKTDWRLPNSRELESLVDDTSKSPQIDMSFFPNAQAVPYWASTTYASDITWGWAKPFNIYGQGIYVKTDSYYNHYVRCVRGGKIAAPPPTLSITVSPKKGGIVTGGGIKCGTNSTGTYHDICDKSFAKSTKVTLTATANEGYAFLNWDAGNNRTNCLSKRTITINSHMSLEANFPTTLLKAGWSSETGYKWADTDVRRKIVQAAKDAIGKSSGESVVCTRKDACWQTDVENNDGARMRRAISIYDQWKQGVGYQGYTLAKVKSVMLNAFSGSNYTASSKNTLVNRIVSVYTTDSDMPTTQNDTLKYLGIRKQCLEWAMTIALKAGGVARSYKTSGSVAKSNIRPGMGYYNKGTHAMIIIDTKYNAAGKLIALQVAESNYAAKWSNPPGEIPWKRTIGTRGGATSKANVPLTYTIVDYDPKK